MNSQIEGFLDVVNSTLSLAKENWRELNGNQRDFLKHDFDCFSIFDYAIDDSTDRIIFLCNDDTYLNICVNLNLNSLLSSREIYVEYDRKVVASYHIETDALEKLTSGLKEREGF